MNEPEIVEEPVAKKLFVPVKPMAVVVELYPVLTVHGKENDEIVMGVEPMIVACVHDEPPEHESVVVAMDDSLAGEPLDVVHIAS